LVSIAADASLEQLIPQADEWSLKKMMRIALTTAAAVRDLHKQGKVHPNLQPRNILAYQHQRLELVDHQNCFAHKNQDTFYGRWPYIAPEHDVTQSGNIYSLGIILWQLSSGIVFPHWVTTSPDLFRIRPLKHMDEDYQALYKRCLSRQPNERPTADDVCEALVQMMISHMALGHDTTKSEAHAAEVRENQMRI
ncbi:kinase-like protein, partial [Backusella circina FSU 941]